MNDIAALLRFLQLYTHNAHNLCYGETFFQDHDYFGELYPAYEAAYDNVVERMIGLDLNPDLIQIQEISVSILKKYPSGSFQTILEGEKKLCLKIQQLVPSSQSEGTKQMLGDICDKSEIRQYKLKQRMKQ